MVDDLEGRIAAALEFARSEEQRLSAESVAAESGPQRSAAGIQASAFNAVRVVLEEVLEPGSHASQGPPALGPPFAPHLADAPAHPEEPR